LKRPHLANRGNSATVFANFCLGSDLETRSYQRLPAFGACK